MLFVILAGTRSPSHPWGLIEISAFQGISVSYSQEGLLWPSEVPSHHSQNWLVWSLNYMSSLIMECTQRVSVHN